jgi:hypothetical protein
MSVVMPGGTAALVPALTQGEQPHVVRAGLDEQGVEVDVADPRPAALDVAVVGVHDILLDLPGAVTPQYAVANRHVLVPTRACEPTTDVTRKRAVDDHRHGFAHDQTTGNPRFVLAENTVDHRDVLAPLCDAAGNETGHVPGEEAVDVRAVRMEVSDPADALGPVVVGEHAVDSEQAPGIALILVRKNRLAVKRRVAGEGASAQDQVPAVGQVAVVDCSPDRGRVVGEDAVDDRGIGMIQLHRPAEIARAVGDREPLDHGVERLAAAEVKTLSGALTVDDARLGPVRRAQGDKPAIEAQLPVSRS